MKAIIAIGLLLSVVFISGCTAQETSTTTSTTTTIVPVMTTDELENQAAGIIEQEMEDATKGINTSELEGLIPE